MAAIQPTESPYLKRPLYLYSLPTDLVNTIALHRKEVPGIDNTIQPNGNDATARSETADNSASATTCSLCKASFKTVAEQRQHARSDLHRYNLKLSLKGLPAVDEDTFVRQIGDLDESISGSESSEDDSDEDGEHDTILKNLLKKQLNVSPDDRDGQISTLVKRGPGNAPMYWMTSPVLPSGYGLGMYRAIFTTKEQELFPSHTIEVLQEKQIEAVQTKHNASGQPIKSITSSPHLFLCMIGGGHFAAAIIGLAPEIRRGPGGVEERHAIVMAHKTFHRYTTRRKQGGSQSANDNAKGNAHSVGSSIRRANEAALVQDIRSLLTEWKSMIDSAELVFVRATGSQNRNTLFGQYDGQILNSKDPRVRGFPFSTRRATQSELLRAFQELTRVKIAQLVEEEEKPSKPIQIKPKELKSTTPKLDPEQEEAQVHTTQLQNLIRRSRAPALIQYYSKHSIPSNFTFHPSNEGINRHAPTPLHLAASINSPIMVQTLLTKASTDPTIRNEDGKVAYDIAGDHRTRDAFRTSRHILGEQAFDWTVAHIPSALTPEQAEARSKQEAASAAKTEADRRKQDLEQIQKDEESAKATKIERRAGAGKTLSEMTWTEKQEQESIGLTPEMRARLERERRARAAEARMKTLAGR